MASIKSLWRRIKEWLSQTEVMELSQEREPQSQLVKVYQYQVPRTPQAWMKLLECCAKGTELELIKMYRSQGLKAMPESELETMRMLEDLQLLSRKLKARFSNSKDQRLKVSLAKEVANKFNSDQP